MLSFIADIIQGLAPAKSVKIDENKQAQIVITADTRSNLVLIGLNISKCLLRLKLQQHRSEAAVLDERSVSVWRCTYMDNNIPDAGEISAVLSVS